VKTKIKTVYYCEYCGRHRLTSYSIKEHEKHCTLNPHRICGMCDCSDLTPVLEKYRDRFRISGIEEKLEPSPHCVPVPDLGVRIFWVWTKGEVTIKDIEADTGGCPACTLAVLRQTGIDEWPSPIEFDYQKARKEWWEEVNATQEEHHESMVL